MGEQGATHIPLSQLSGPYDKLFMVVQPLCAGFTGTRISPRYCRDMWVPVVRSVAMAAGVVGFVWGAFDEMHHTTQSEIRTQIVPD